MYLLQVTTKKKFMDLIYQYILSFLSIFVAYFVFKKLTIKLPPGPRPWPIVGNLYDMKPEKFWCLVNWGRHYGPIVSVWFGSSLNVIVSNSELAKEVLKEHDQQLASRCRSRSIAKFSKGGKDLTWADYGPQYVRLKHICTIELFSPKRLEALRPIREDEVTAMIESIFNDCTSPENNGKSLLVKKYLDEVTFNNMTRLVYGKRFEEEKGVLDEQGLQIKGILAKGFNLNDEFGAIKEHMSWFFPFKGNAFGKHVALRDKITKQMIEEHIIVRHKSGEDGKQHFLDALITLQKEYKLNDDTIICLLWDMIIMGMDTVATSVEWALAELIKSPRLQKKAQEELDRVTGLDRVMTEWDYSNLPYLRCIVKETLRLHPSMPFFLPHKANTNVKIGGYDIPKGSSVLVNAWAIARDPTIWKNPLEFQPERFMEEDVDLKGHDFRLLPFGAGRRVCPGAQLGFNLVTSMLGHLLHHFNWTPADGLMYEDIDMGEKLGLVAEMKTPLQAFAIPRLPKDLYKRIVVDM